MFKTIVTLMRAQAFEAEQRVKDQHALALLDQQMRDAAAIVERARKSLAIAMAQERQEAVRLEGLEARIADLETRALAALHGGREDLAAKAAESIAALEADVAATKRAQGLFATEIAKLGAQARKQGERLAELERGRRVARAAQAARHARRGGMEPGFCCANTMADAETTLARLRERQCESEAADAALAGLEAESESENVAETLSRAGFGPPKQPRASDVLARLKERAAGAPAA